MKLYESLSDLQEDLKKGTTSVKEVVQYHISKIKENKHLNAFLEVYETEALKNAEHVDEKIKDGDTGRLFGLVVGLKDVLCHKNHKLSCSSKILESFESQFNGTAVERLLQEDAIVIGRQNCDEFAMGSSNENSAYGPTRNAVDSERVPGGSSGGSAVAVQADMCRVSLGTDTGGSVRQPGAFCGVIGLKPTYSRISRYGLSAYASSFDTIGVFSKNISDAATVLEIIAGEDHFDSTISKTEVPAYSRHLDFPDTPKVGYIPETLDNEGINQEVKEATWNRINWLKDQGFEVEPVKFDLLDYVLPTYYILTTAEASSNLSRYDGVRYGHRTEGPKNLEEMYKKTRAEGFGSEVKKRIMLGTFVLSASYYDAYYTKAQKVRRLIKQKTEEMLQDYEFIITPTTPDTAFKLGEKTDNQIEMYLEDLFTVQASVAGVPAISIPNGEDSGNLPIGFQIMSRDFNESRLLAFSDYILKNHN
ncbi:MAG: Asp-tRNA(Asn)/Glu-tRNA(Gln) amidotransferase subunit GatA [Bacteroidota bacterium]